MPWARRWWPSARPASALYRMPSTLGGASACCGTAPTAFIRKAIEEHRVGNAELTIVFAPVQNYVNLAVEAAAGSARGASAGISVEIRSMGRVRWVDPETGERCPSPGPVAMFIFRSQGCKSAEG